MSFCRGLLVLAFGLVLTAPALAGPASAPASAPAPAAASPAATPGSTPAVAPAAAPAATAPAVASAPIVYLDPTYANLLHTAVRFNAFDMHDDLLLDEYAAVTDCEIYKFYYKDDFKWQEVRKKLRESAELVSQTYPTHYAVKTVLLLDRYDFDKKIYRFAANNQLHNVNVFKVFHSSNSDICIEHLKLKYIPEDFKALSSTPVNLTGLPLAPSDAQSLLRLMNADKNTDHEVFVKVDMTVNYVGHLRKIATDPGAADSFIKYSQDGQGREGEMRLDVQIDAVEFYEDPAMTKLIYSYKPNA